jgi:hypothetical protein
MKRQKKPRATTGHAAKGLTFKGKGRGDGLTGRFYRMGGSPIPGGVRRQWGRVSLGDVCLPPPVWKAAGRCLRDNPVSIVGKGDSGGELDQGGDDDDPGDDNKEYQQGVDDEPIPG